MHIPQVLGFLEKENRPYNVGNLVDAMHGAVKKGEMQRVLDQLEERKLISVKEFGKNKVRSPGPQQSCLHYRMRVSVTSQSQVTFIASDLHAWSACAVKRDPKQMQVYFGRQDKLSVQSPEVTRCSERPTPTPPRNHVRMLLAVATAGGRRS